MKILYFSATWCGPCKSLAPIINEIATSNNISIEKIDIDENPNLVKDYSIRSVPTLIFEENNKELGRNIGFANKAKLQNLITNLR